MKTVLPLCCFPNIHWVATFLSPKCEVVVDLYENYVKQSFRNRFEILGPNGRQLLTVPVVGQKGQRIAMNQIEIVEGKWQKEHLHTLKTAYSSSPFYEHYQHQPEQLFLSPPLLLMDFNKKALEFCLEELGVEKDPHFSSEYQRAAFETDLRNEMKKSEGPLAVKEYNQVFEDRFAFESNLSVLDLLFNLGPEGLLHFH